MKVTVHLHKNRAIPGALDIEDVAEERSFRCLGQSDLTAAAQHNNIERDPLKPFGNIPTGEYKAVRTVPADVTDPANLRSYGPYPRFVLNPVEGQALDALHAGRFGLLLHGGALDTSGKILRPTHGCVRADDSTLEYLSKNCPPSFPVTVVEDLP